MAHDPADLHDAALAAMLDVLTSEAGDDGRPSEAAKAAAARIPDVLREMAEEDGEPD